MAEIKMQWRTEKRKLADLKLYDKNPRKIFKEEFEALKRDIEEQGFHAVLTIDTDGTVLSGNQRKLALEQLGFEEVDCRIPERALTGQERERINITHNKHRGVWDYDKLANFFDIGLLQEAGFNMRELGIGNRDEAIPGENDAQYTACCPHCEGKMKLSNRVKSVEKA
jgi:ParB-like chromosome segregation protein Spo0J